MSISLQDPKIILAGIRRFGLAADGSDLRDLEAAIDRLAAQQDGAWVWCTYGSDFLAFKPKHASGPEQ